MAHVLASGLLLEHTLLRTTALHHHVHRMHRRSRTHILTEQLLIGIIQSLKLIIGLLLLGRADLRGESLALLFSASITTSLLDIIISFEQNWSVLKLDNLRLIALDVSDFFDEHFILLLNFIIFLNKIIPLFLSGVSPTLEVFLLFFEIVHLDVFKLAVILVLLGILLSILLDLKQLLFAHSLLFFEPMLQVLNLLSKVFLAKS
mmetsp:Transcript_3788/g.3233  ORF Transcript_3788/g.3233 Transcript_3788/m.3233 type:complete len:204 (-) Transcript_3788:915-1526(-)